MELNKELNLIDADILVQDFFKDRKQSIIVLHKIFFKKTNQLSLQALIEELTEELRTGCVTFINKNSPLEEINSYLFYIANAYCKKIAIPFVKTKNDYLCPACIYLGNKSIIEFNKVFKCSVCAHDLQICIDPIKNKLLTTFYCHNKSGYRCLDCNRFLPHPIDNSLTISCPYFDCTFVGPFSMLRKMNHPTLKSNPEKLVLDLSFDRKSSLKDSIVSQDANALAKVEITESLQKTTKVIKEIIEAQANNIYYSSSDFTVKHKQYVYNAFSNLLEKFPIEMTQYLSGELNGYAGFQHKIFQEYIRLLEEALPFFITKKRKLYKIDSLLDRSFCLFDGISIFSGSVNEKLNIKNETKEFYIGGRKASYTKPFYIGKLLSVIDVNTNESLLPMVKEYSFSKIKMRDVKFGTPVTVTHLRVPPHYQMGGMVYVNRIRKKIIDRAKSVLEKESYV